ncbi:MAG: glycosyltransferase [Vicinamibacterales bacterium]
MRILFVVPYAPSRVRTRPFHLIRALSAEGHDVTVATLCGSAADWAGLDELGLSRDALVVERMSLARSLWNCAATLPGSEPLQASYSWHPALASRLAALVDRGAFDAVHVEHLRGARYALALADRTAPSTPRRPPVIWDSVDCISDLFERAASQGRSRRVRAAARLELPRTARLEGAMTSRVARTLATSEVDRQGLLRLAERGAIARPGLASTIVVVPNGVDLDYFSPAATPRDPATLVVTGKMSYHANVAAVVRLVEDVMPRVWAARPDARLEIVGQDPSPEVRRLAVADRVVVTGTVSDIRPYLRRATVAVAPIQYGAGIQNKVLEALACGTPMVATPTAVAGFGGALTDEVVVADGPDALARAVLVLLDGPARRAELSRAGRRFVETRHDWRAIAARLAEIYADARD